jgi:uncharacterized protein
MRSDAFRGEPPVITDPRDFDQGSGSLPERILFNHRRLVLVLCCLVTALLGLQAAKLRLNARFDKMVPTRHPYVVNYTQNRQDLQGVGNAIRIAVETTSGTVFDAKYLEMLRRINDEVFLIPGVDRPYMKSLWTPSTRWLSVTEEGLEGGPVIPDDYDGSAQSLEQVRANVERSGEIGQLVAANYKSTVLFVPLLDRDPQTGRSLDYRRLSTAVEQIRANYQAQGLRLHVTGFAKIVGDLIAGLQAVLLFFAIAIGIAVIVLYWYARCLRSAMLVILCSLGAVAWLLGLLPTLGYELDPYSMLVPFLVFAIGVSHGAQKMNGIMRDIGRGTHKLVAARYTFRRLFLAGLTALLAAAAGFGVLVLIPIRVIQDLAITASIGVGVLIFTNLIMLPILLSYVGVSPRAARKSLEAELSETEPDRAHPRHVLLHALTHFTQGKWAAVALISAGALGTGAFVYSQQLRVGDLDPGAPELRPDSRYNRDNAFMTANYAASSDILVVLVKTPLYRCSAYNTVAAVDALEWKLQQLPGVVSTLSFAGVSRRSAAGLNEGSLKWYDVPRTQAVLNATTTRASRELLNHNCDLLSLYSFLRDHKAATLESVVAEVEAFAARNNTDELKFLLAAGNAGFEAATNIVVERASHQMLWLVYAAIVALCFVTFRSWRAVLCAVLPLVLTSILCEALMVMLGIGVKVATLPVIALGVGIGVDYALYVLTVALAHLRQGATLTEAYYRSLLFTGKVVVLAGVTLSVAVATWAFSPIKFQADMGLLLAFMFVWNMLGTLILLPALARVLLQPRAMTKNAGEDGGRHGATRWRVESKVGDMQRTRAADAACRGGARERGGARRRYRLQAPVGQHSEVQHRSPRGGTFSGIGRRHQRGRRRSELRQRLHFSAPGPALRAGLDLQNCGREGQRSRLVRSPLQSRQRQRQPNPGELRVGGT